jgi:oligopeptide/dipeptide ABC transporter ATP-binding protein
MEIAKPSELLDRSMNPYTQVLLSAIPKLDSQYWLKDYEGAQRAVDPNGFSGCSFYPKCPRAESVCAKSRPPLKSHDENEGHLAACHFPLSGTP